MGIINRAIDITQAGIASAKGEKRISSQGIVKSYPYIFENSTAKEKEVMTTFASLAQAHNIPVNLSEDRYVAGDKYFNNAKTTMLTIDAGYTCKCAVGVVTFGDYLNVTLYAYVDSNFLNTLKGTNYSGFATYGEDIISVRDSQSFINSCHQVLLETFERLRFHETNHGFFGIK